MFNPISKSVVVPAIVLALIGFGPSAANASLIGDTVAAQYVINSPTNVYYNEGTAVVGDGVEFKHAINDNLTYDFDANSVTIRFRQWPADRFCRCFLRPCI